jgi:hypothetical protein
VADYSELTEKEVRNIAAMREYQRPIVQEVSFYSATFLFFLTVVVLSSSPRFTFLISARQWRIGMSFLRSGMLSLVKLRHKEYPHFYIHRQIKQLTNNNAPN